MLQTRGSISQPRTLLRRLSTQRSVTYAFPSPLQCNQLIYGAQYVSSPHICTLQTSIGVAFDFAGVHATLRHCRLVYSKPAEAPRQDHPRRVSALPTPSICAHLAYRERLGSMVWRTKGESIVRLYFFYNLTELPRLPRPGGVTHPLRPHFALEGFARKQLQTHCIYPDSVHVAPALGVRERRTSRREALGAGVVEGMGGDLSEGRGNLGNGVPGIVSSQAITRELVLTGTEAHSHSRSTK